MNKKVWLIGAGVMAEAYAKVLKALKPAVDFTVIGRSAETTRRFEENTGIPAISGGIEAFIKNNPGCLPDAVIVSVGVPELAETTKILLEAGCLHILLEKPGGATSAEIKMLASLSRAKKANVVLAYNRHFYESVKMARKLIKNDGGATSFHFEFTEWNHVIEKISKPQIVFDNWMLANSSHVIDLAFFLGGKPEQMNCVVSGELSWHKPGAVFCGAGKTEQGTPFSYHANWKAPGRWGVEVMTDKHRYILRPLEKLQIQDIGSVAIQECPIDDHLDLEFKPGLYCQVASFFNNELDDFINLDDQIVATSWCEKIAGTTF